MNRLDRRIAKTIQAMAAEGIKETVDIESLLTHTRITTAIAGVTNNYKDYDSQVRETYRKYNGQSDWGNQICRAIIDFRTSFIAGEGLSISANNEVTAKWINNFIKKNALNGSQFINSVQGTEMSGQTIYVLKVINKSKDIEIAVARYPYNFEKPYKPYYSEYSDAFSIVFKELNDKGIYEKILILENSVPVVTGGDNLLSCGPTTKVGLVLNDIENYDRAIKDIRRLNHILARITPTVETKNQAETKSVLSFMAKLRWRIGEIFVSTGKFKYEVPTTGAHDNLVIELVASIKNISAVTTIPVHWLGYVDLMSNRSTAESLYEVVKNGTINERVIHAEAIYKLILAAQQLYIDNGGNAFRVVDSNFEVKIPLLDFNSFVDRVKALSIALSDNIISKLDYQNFIPGIDPLETNRQIAKEAKDEKNKFIIPEEENDEQ